MGDKKKVLVAEDDPEYLDLLRYALETAGYEVVPCEDGGIALKKALEEKPDMVVTDVRMPGLDGYHFAQELGDKLGADCPKILIMTSRDIERERGVAMLSGAASIIQKPFKISDFKDKVAELLAAS